MSDNSSDTLGGSRSNTRIDSKTLVQVDSTVIVGVLFFLTLTSFIGTTGAQGKYYIGIITAAIAGPFAGSGILLLFKPDKYLRIAQTLTAGGFLYLLVGLAFVIMLGVNILPTSGGFFVSQEEQCAKDPEPFNVTHRWQCSEFSPGSLAEQCAINSERFNMKKSECSGFIAPSNDEVKN